MAKLLSGLSCPDMVDPAAVTALAKGRGPTPTIQSPPSPPRPGLSAHVPPAGLLYRPCKGAVPSTRTSPEYIRLLGEGRQARGPAGDSGPQPPAPHHGQHLRPPLRGQVHPRLLRDPIRIREAKLAAAEGRWKTVLPEIRPLASRPDLKVAVVGGGPAGMAAAFFLARGGAAVSLFGLREALGGVVRHIIPCFASPRGRGGRRPAIDPAGVDIRLNTPAPLPEKLFNQGYTTSSWPVGAWSPANCPLEGQSRHERPGLFWAAAGRGARSLKAPPGWRSSAAATPPWTRPAPPSGSRGERMCPSSTAAPAAICPPTWSELELTAKVGVELKDCSPRVLA